MPDEPRFTLRVGRWYGWQMLPGYTPEEGYAPYFSPILVVGFKSLKTGKGELRIRFWNTGYAPGVQVFDYTMRVLYRGGSYIVGDLNSGGCCAVISTMSFDWIRSFTPRVMERADWSSCSDVYEFLDRVFHPNPGMFDNGNEWEAN